ncbi:serine/threonine-protein kinase [Streptomyces sp. SID3343]|uniref:serine/threonine-protein kinase n=1 Tax=Streptomyces sp. SID3343 TaxID=2690260 RepID=UPI001F16F259|nr:serine/threonine-protein kinase [Streptomyces sp. SID3343]
MTDPETPERLVAGRYRLGERLGRGGMGTVWRAVDTMLDRDVAVKELRVPRYVDDDDRGTMSARMLREARAAARIDHPNVVTIFDVAEEDGRPSIVMELVRGMSLAQELDKDGPVAPGRAAELGLRLLAALEAAHEAGVLHRDVKPANVLLARNGRVVLTDFGVASVEDSATLTQAGAMVGSPEYLAPEQIAGESPGPASDLWSLGATLFEAVEGRPAFRRNTHAATLAAVAAGRFPEIFLAGPLTPALKALMVKDPARRGTIAEVRELLADVADTPPMSVGATPERFVPGRTRPGGVRRHGVRVPGRTPEPADTPRPHRPETGRTVGASAYKAPVGSVDETFTNLRLPREGSGAGFRARYRRWPRWWFRHWTTILTSVGIATAAGARWLAAFGSWTGMYTIVLLALALGVWLVLPHRRISRSVPVAMLLGVIAGGALQAAAITPNPIIVLALIGGCLVLGPLVDGQVIPRLRRRRRTNLGFALPVPEGWICTDSPSGLTVTDPDRLISVTVTVDRGIVMAPEESVAHREHGSIGGRDRRDGEDYERLLLQAIDYRGHEAAEWEYVWCGQDLTNYHGKDLVVRTASGVRYWLTVRGRDDLWGTAGAYYEHARGHLSIAG